METTARGCRYFPTWCPSGGGRELAEAYDRVAADDFAPAVLGPMVDLLAELADGGPVVEFGVGTGRVALPLAARGLAVQGIELSPEMADQLMR